MKEYYRLNLYVFCGYFNLDLDVFKIFMNIQLMTISGSLSLLILIIKRKLNFDFELEGLTVVFLAIILFIFLKILQIKLYKEINLDKSIQNKLTWTKTELIKNVVFVLGSHLMFIVSLSFLGLLVKL